MQTYTFFTYKENHHDLSHQRPIETTAIGHGWLHCWFAEDRGAARSRGETSSRGVSTPIYCNNDSN